MLPLSREGPCRASPPLGSSVGSPLLSRILSLSLPSVDTNSRAPMFHFLGFLLPDRLLCHTFLARGDTQVGSFCPLKVLVRCYFGTFPDLGDCPHPSAARGLLLSVQATTHIQGARTHNESCLVSAYVTGQLRNHRPLVLALRNLTASGRM